METNKFNDIINRRIDDSLRVLIHKAKEYATEDRLHNFKRGAEVQGTTPEKALLGYMTKHLVSVIDILNQMERNQMPTLAFWDEKIGDLFNYVLLLDAQVQERIEYNK